MAYQNPTSGGSLDIGRAFQFMFEDPRWVTKVAIGGGILLGGVLLSFLVLPILAASFLLLGYTVTVIRNVAEGNPTPLPEWNDFGGLFMKGLYAIIGIIVLQLPAIIVACCIAAVTAALSNQGTDSNASGALGTVILCLQCIIWVYSLVVGIFMYAPLTRYALNGQISTFWDFRGNLAFIQANTGSYLVAWILAIVASIIGGFGYILCVIPGFFTTFWATLVSAHLFGQYARMSGATGMAPAPMPPMAPPPMAPPPAAPGQY